MIALQTLISVAALLYLAFGLYNGLRVDSLRMELFAIRDRLFDEAADGKIRFDSQAYMATRTSLNGMIRFAHQVSLARLFAGLFLLKKHDFEFAARRMELAMSASPEPDRVLCQAYLQEANRALVMHVMRSPYAYLLIVPAITAATMAMLGVNAAAWTARHLKKQLRVLDGAAYARGSAV